MHKLEVSALTMQFGGLTAVNSVDFHIDENEIIGLIGPNGAGKTTFFNMLTGLYKPSSGKILYMEKEITGFKPNKITTIGIARTFQNIRLFPMMTALENVKVGMHTRNESGIFDAVFKTRRYKKEERENIEKAEEILNMVDLLHKKDELSKNLPYGEQRKLEIARAMASNPGIILLDEPAAGMNENETAELTEFIKKLKTLGKTVLLIEHDMNLVMNICDRLYVLDHGVKIAEGTPQEIQNNVQVIEAYLGKGVAQ